MGPYSEAVDACLPKRIRQVPQGHRDLERTTIAETSSPRREETQETMAGSCVVLRAGKAEEGPTLKISRCLSPYAVPSIGRVRKRKQKMMKFPPAVEQCSL